MKRAYAVITALFMLLLFGVSVFAEPEAPVYTGLSEASAMSASYAGAKVGAGLSAGSRPELALFSHLLSVPYGDIPVDLSAEGCGPESFSVGPDGSIAILDSINGCIMVYDGDGLASVIRVPRANYPYLLEQNSSAWFVLDYGGTMLRIDKHSGQTAVLGSFPGNGSALSMLREGENVYIYTDAGVLRRVEGDPAAGAVNSPCAAGRFIGRDAKGNVYYIRYSYMESPVCLAEAVLIRYDAGGRPTGCAVLRTEEYEFCPNDNVAVTPEGGVYVIACMEGGVNVFSIAMGRVYESHLDDLEARAEYILRGLPVPERDVDSEKICIGSFASAVFAPAFIIVPDISLDAQLYERSFVPVNYTEPFCRIFFRVLLQAPG